MSIHLAQTGRRKEESQQVFLSFFFFFCSTLTAAQDKIAQIVSLDHICSVEKTLVEELSE